jgi:hypothetical protein
MDHDVFQLIVDACFDLLAPNALAHLSATSSLMRQKLQPSLGNLRVFRERLRVLCLDEQQHGLIAMRDLSTAPRLVWVGTRLCGETLDTLKVLLLEAKLPNLVELVLYGQIDWNHSERPWSSRVTLAHFPFLGLIKRLSSAPHPGVLGSLRVLFCARSCMNDVVMKSFSSAISGGALGSLRSLQLFANSIGCEGMAAFARAITPTDTTPRGSLSSLERLNFSGNSISDTGMQAFSDAIRGGALASLVELYLRYNMIGDRGMKAFSTALSSGALGSLGHLFLDNNRFGDAGIIAFANAIGPTNEIHTAALVSLVELHIVPGPNGAHHPALSTVCGERRIELQSVVSA